MARLTLGAKTDRVLKLLLGLSNAEIASAVVAHGFGAEELE